MSAKHDLIFIDDLESLTHINNNYRKVLYTTNKNEMQLVLMSIDPKDEIGKEIHDTVTQFFRVEQGSGLVVIGENKLKRKIKSGDAIIIPAGTVHNIINTGDKPLKLYTIYVPANHPKGTIEKKKKKEIS